MKLRVLVAFAVIQASHTIAEELPEETTKKQPHLILIVADDLGWNDVSWHNPGAVTPHLGDLARGGVILNQSYVLPICTPTRSALLTGRYPFTLGRQHGTIRPSEPTGLVLNATLLPQALKKVGYTTHAVGKWHLGFCNWAYTPTYRGFDTFYGYYNGAEDYFKHLRNCLHETDCESCFSATNNTGGAHFGLDLRNNTTPDPDKEGIYSSHLFASYIKDLLESRNPDDPMFMYLPFQNVHAPLMVPANYTKPYKHIHDFNRRIYLGMVSALDEAVGRVVQALKSTGHYNNSVIVFTTDNGGTCHHGGNNWPLRGMKSTFWEGGTRGAAFVHSPLLNNSGTVSNKLIHATDWFQTFVNLAGGVAPTDTDGFDQWEAISNSSPSPRKNMVYNIDNTQQFRAAVRIGDYKLLVGNPGESDWTPPPELLQEQGKVAASTLSTPADKTRLENSILNPDQLSENGRSGNSATESQTNLPVSSGSRRVPSTASDFNWFISKASHIRSRRDQISDHKINKKYLKSHARYNGPFFFNAEVPVHQIFQQQESSVQEPHTVSTSPASFSTPFSTGSDETEINKKTEEATISRHSNNVSKVAAETFKTEEIIFTFTPCKDQKEGLVSGLKSPELNLQKDSVNHIDEKDGITWQHLLNEHLRNDMWFANLSQQLDFLKNETEIRLYNIIDDPEERKNLAETEINTVKVLLEFLLKEFMNRYIPADVPDEVPEANPKYWNNVWSPGWCKAK